MDRFLETYNIPHVNQKETDYVNRQITSSKTKVLILKIPTNKSAGLTVSQRNSTKHKGELLFNLYQIIPKIKDDETFPNLF